MSDADVNEAEIEQYKIEVKAGGDPVAVSRRWVHVGAVSATEPCPRARR